MGAAFRSALEAHLVAQSAGDLTPEFARTRIRGSGPRLPSRETRPYLADEILQSKKTTREFPCAPRRDGACRCCHVRNTFRRCGQSVPGILEWSPAAFPTGCECSRKHPLNPSAGRADKSLGTGSHRTSPCWRVPF